MTPITLTQQLWRRWKNVPADFRILIGALSLFAVGQSIVDPAFNNYVRDTFDLSASARGNLEFPRELPGFLVAVTSGLLFFLPEVRTIAVAMGVGALGIAGLAWAGPQYAVMIVFMMLWSAGMHLIGPMRNSIVLSFARSGRQASLLGTIGSLTTFAVILGAGASWTLFTVGGKNEQTYHTAFIIGASMAALGGILALRMSTSREGARTVRPKLVWNWKYRIYYILSVLFGARKQIFITFAPWVLITVFDQGPSTFAALTMTSAVLGIGWQPLIGRLIDRFGERTVLMMDGMALFVICIGYGYAHRIGSGAFVIGVVLVCFILDQMLFAVGMARTTYINRIAEKKEDVTASLSLGVTLDHAVSMSIPALGGVTWMAFGFEYVFLGAGALALCSTLVASFIDIPGEMETVPRIVPDVGDVGAEPEPAPRAVR